MRKLLFTTICALYLSQVNSSMAGECQGSDVRVSFITPNPGRFDTSKPTAPVLAKWEAKDGRVTFQIKQRAIQPNSKPSQSVLETEFLAEINSLLKNGKLVASTMQMRDGCNVFTMTAQAENGATAIYFTQKVLATDEKKCLLIAVAVGIGTDTRLDADAAEFIYSLKPVASTPAQPAQTVASTRSERTGSGSSAQQSQDSNSQQNTGGAGIYLGMRILIGVIALLLGGSKSCRDTLMNKKTGVPRKSW